MTIDELIQMYADRLDFIYNNQTAGDYTFIGILADYTRKLDELRAIEKAKPVTRKVIRD